jgi:hypothetical protein
MAEDKIICAERGGEGREDPDPFPLLPDGRLKIIRFTTPAPNLNLNIALGERNVQISE